MKSLLLVLVGLVACAKAKFPPSVGESSLQEQKLPLKLTVGKKELKRFPLRAELPGDAPASGLRYWEAPFKPLKANGAYVSVIIRNGQYELWRGSLIFKGTNTEGRLAPNYQKAQVNERVCIVSSGPDLHSLAKAESRFDAALINDVSPPKAPGILSQDRGFTRTSMSWFPGMGYVFYCCVTHGYSPGAVPLLPAIMVSKTGQPGTWRYLGKMKGDPSMEAAKRVIWCDGGSIHRLDNGRWRAYLNGFGQVAAAVESDKLDGEWKFVRDHAGNIRELLPDFPKGPGGSGVWIHVLRVTDEEWHMWLTDTWPAQAIWHFTSRNGLDWKAYGRQPEITRRSVGGHGIKCMRTFIDPKEKKIVGLLSVWGKIGDRPSGWVLHASHLPLGLQPQSPQK